MIGFVLGLLTALIEVSLLFPITLGFTPIPIFVVIIVYLFRFNLRPLGWQTALWTGLWLDLLSTSRFGLLLTACLLGAALCDWLIPHKGELRGDGLALWLTFLGGLSGGILLTLTAGFGFWFAVSRGIWSGLIVLVLFVAASRLTIRWRLYE